MEIQLMRRLLGFVSSIALASASALAQQAGPISNMPFAATPLSGSEQMYIVQGGVSKKIAVGALRPAGVSCSGSPTSSFASVNGIVTHC